MRLRVFCSVLLFVVALPRFSVVADEMNGIDAEPELPPNEADAHQEVPLNDWMDEHTNQHYDPPTDPIELLFYRVMSNELEAVKELLAEGPDLTIYDHMGQSILHAAVITQSVEIVEMLIKGGADVNAKTKNEDKSSVLEWVAFMCDDKFVKPFLEAGADPNIMSHDGNPLLVMLTKEVANGREDCKPVIEMLREYGAEVSDEVLANTRSDDEEMFDFVAKGDVDAVRELVTLKGANIHARNAYGESVLHISAISGSSEMIKFLIDHGADVDAVTHGTLEGHDKPVERSVLHWFVYSCEPSHMRLLLEAGADPNFLDEEETHLLQAIARRVEAGEEGCVKTGELLRKFGATLPSEPLAEWDGVDGHAQHNKDVERERQAALDQAEAAELERLREEL